MRIRTTPSIRLSGTSVSLPTPSFESLELWRQGDDEKADSDDRDATKNNDEMYVCLPSEGASSRSGGCIIGGVLGLADAIHESEMAAAAPDGGVDCSDWEDEDAPAPPY